VFVIRQSYPPTTLVPEAARTKDYVDAIRVSYPLHPRLMDTAENRLRVMPDYNLSRGTLRLFARMVRDLWDDPSRDPELITAGDIDWSSTCTLYLGSFQPFLCRTVGGVVGRITSLYLVPTLYHDPVGHPDFAACDTSSVTKLGFAGAAMPDGLLKRVDAAFRPALFVNHYGSSEIYTFTTEPRAAAKPGSAGKAGLNQRIRVVKIGTDNPGARAATGEEGQIIADRARPSRHIDAVRTGRYSGAVRTSDRVGVSAGRGGRPRVGHLSPPGRFGVGSLRAD